MNSHVHSLIADVADARERFVAALGDPSPEQAAFRPEPDIWSLTDNTEHVVLAERGGTNGLWKALDGCRRNAPVWAGERVHDGRSIEQVVAATWRERESAPPIALPSWGGPIAYWIAALRAAQFALEALGSELTAAETSGIALESVIYVQPVSGPLDALQRLQFLRFHLDRHAEQVRRLRAHALFPA